MGRGANERPPMFIPTRCARCLNINKEDSILCSWCAYEDARASHRLEGHEKPIKDCPACQPPPNPFI